MKTTMTLYYSPGTCSLAPHILLEKAGVQYDLVEANVAQGRTREAAFLELNPKGRVPVLVTGKEVLTEVAEAARAMASRGRGVVPAAAWPVADRAA